MQITYWSPGINLQEEQGTGDVRRSKKAKPKEARIWRTEIPGTETYSKDNKETIAEAQLQNLQLWGLPIRN